MVGNFTAQLKVCDIKVGEIIVTKPEEGGSEDGEILEGRGRERSSNRVREILIEESNNVKDENIGDLLLFGFDIHHAGMTREDRRQGKRRSQPPKSTCFCKPIYRSSNSIVCRES